MNNSIYQTGFGLKLRWRFSILPLTVSLVLLGIFVYQFYLSGYDFSQVMNWFIAFSAVTIFTVFIYWAFDHSVLVKNTGLGMDGMFFYNGAMQILKVIKFKNTRKIIIFDNGLRRNVDFVTDEECISLRKVPDEFMSDLFYRCKVFEDIEIIEPEKQF